MKPVVFNLKTMSPGAAEDNDVYIGRGSKWGNPFIIGRDGTREEVVEKYFYHAARSPELLRSLPELTGKRLLCFCKPEECHGDVLVFLWMVWHAPNMQALLTSEDACEVVRGLAGRDL